MEQALLDFAEREGFSCAEIFHEDVSGDQRAFAELIQVLKEQEARHVLTPTIRHLADHPLLRQTMLLQLAEAGAHVISVCGQPRWNHYRFLDSSCGSPSK